MWTVFETIYDTTTGHRNDIYIKQREHRADGISHDIECGGRIYQLDGNALDRVQKSHVTASVHDASSSHYDIPESIRTIIEAHLDTIRWRRTPDNKDSTRQFFTRRQKTLILIKLIEDNPNVLCDVHLSEWTNDFISSGSARAVLDMQPTESAVRTVCRKFISYMKKNVPHDQQRPDPN